jgi:hypothetical protein
MRGVRRWCARLSHVGLVVAAASNAGATEVSIDDFGAADSPSPWVFSAGPEFPGAKGSLARGSGESGAGAALAYDFRAGGVYVAMTLKLKTPITASAIGFFTDAVGLPTTLRVVDNTGQTLQYAVVRPLEPSDANGWYRVVVDLSVVSTHSNGVNDGKLHQPISSMSLVAGGQFQAGKSGVIGFDGVVAWDELPAHVDPYEHPTPSPSGAGELATRLGVNVHFTSDDRALDLIAAAGFTHVRTDLLWNEVEQAAGVYDFSPLDRLLSALEARGLKLHLILGYTNPLYPTPTKSGFSIETVPAFAAVAGATAAHFAGKPVSYEIWNEEDTATFWDNAPSAQQYGSLSKAAIAEIHAADLAARVTTGGLSGFDDTFLADMLDAGAAVGADAIGVHPYRHDGPETASGDLANMRKVVSAASGTATPIWDTEWGYSSEWYGDAGGHAVSALGVQAQRVSRELLTVWALGFPLAIYYDIRDDGTDANDAEDDFGLLQNDYGDKPAMVAVRTLTSLARGRTFSGFLPVGFSTLHAMLLTGARDRVLALWNSERGTVREVSIPVPESAMNLLGEPLSTTFDGGEIHVALSELDGPVFLTFQNPANTLNDAGSDGGGVSHGGSGSNGGNGTARYDAGGAEVSKDGAVAASPADSSVTVDGETKSSSSVSSSCTCRAVRAPHPAALDLFLSMSVCCLLALRRARVVAAKGLRVGR